MACGTPVLTSSTSALQETAGGYAYLVDPMDVDAISRGIADLATDPARRTELPSSSSAAPRNSPGTARPSRRLKVYAEALGNGSRETVDGRDGTVDRRR